MKSLFVHAGAVVACALLVPLAQPTTARAQDDLRKAWLNSFSELKKNAEKATKSTAVAKTPVGTGTAQTGDFRAVAKQVMPVRVTPGNGQGPIDARIMVKVWAVPYNNGKEGAKVHPGKYTWGPDEQFYLYFETATPVQIGLYQDDAGKPANKILPDPEFPESFDVILPGQARQFRPRLKVDETANDEVIVLVVTQAQATDDLVLTPPPDNATPGEKKEHAFRSAKRVQEAMNKTAAKGKALSVVPVPDRVEPSPNTDDVAIIAAGPDSSGSITIRMPKAK